MSRRRLVILFSTLVFLAFTIAGLLYVAMVLCKGYRWRLESAPENETGLPGLLNVGLTNRRIMELAGRVAEVPPGAPVAEISRLIPELEGHAQVGIFPVARCHERSDVLFDNRHNEQALAWNRAQRERRLLEDWNDTVKRFPFLDKVAFRPSLSVGRYDLNPTHVLYLVTEYRAPGDERFVTAFVREEKTD